MNHIATNGMHGGLRLDANRSLATARPIRAVDASAELVLPLDQHAGTPATPIVASGDAVLLGQPIAQPSSTISAWLHAPASGRVTAIEPRPSPQLQGAPTLSIVIANDGAERTFEHPRSAG